MADVRFPYSVPPTGTAASVVVSANPATLPLLRQMVQAIQDGTLMTVLGEEIKKSWELYKDKVGPDLANSTNYFKEALNEILADGQEVF